MLFDSIYYTQGNKLEEKLRNEYFNPKTEDFKKYAIYIYFNNKTDIENNFSPLPKLKTSKEFIKAIKNLLKLKYDFTRFPITTQEIEKLHQTLDEYYYFLQKYCYDLSVAFYNETATNQDRYAKWTLSRVTSIIEALLNDIARATRENKHIPMQYKLKDTYGLYWSYMANIAYQL